MSRQPAAWQSLTAVWGNVRHCASGPEAEGEVKESKGKREMILDSAKELSQQAEGRMDRKADSAAPPSSWRNAQERVDLEFLSQGLDVDAEGQRSTWRDEGGPAHNVFWPQPALEEQRSRPFGPDLKGELSEQQISTNQQRLEDLWRLSASHGISWDELDRAYVEFAQQGSKRYAEWSEMPNVDALQGKQGAKRSKDALPEPKPQPLAHFFKKKAEERAVQHLKKFMPEKDPRLVAPSQTKRLAGKLFAQEKKKYFAPWKPGMLTRQLQQLVAASMLRRETAERSYNPKSNK